MRPPVKALAEICARTLPVCDPVYEFGALQVPEQGNYGDLRPYYPKRSFFGADMRLGAGVDVVLDLHEIKLENATAGTVLLYDTLEHVEFPSRALDEVYRILHPDGFVVVTTPFAFPIHSYPNDYWRFTPEGLRSLLHSFGTVHVDAVGDALSPHLVFGVAFKQPGREFQLTALKAELAAWKAYWCDPMGPRVNRWAEWAKMRLHPFVPKQLLALRRRVLNRSATP